MNGEVDFGRWAVVAHKDDTGFGRQAADIRAVLGVGWHFVVPSERLTDHPVDGVRERWMRPKATDGEVLALLAEVDGVIFFERPNWHPRLLELARQAGVKTVCVPNWEWFRGHDPLWRACDFLACPTKFTEQVVRRFGFTRAKVLPWPLDLAKLPRREVHGPARVFVHNAGIVDPDDRKGTRDTIRAFMRVKRDDLTLVVRLQKPAELPAHDRRVKVAVGNLTEVAELYATGEVCIQPSKMEGIGFMVLEPVACGLPVITTDYPPMSEVVQQPEMRCARRWFKRRARATQWVPHAHLSLPRERDLAAKIAWCAEQDMGTISRQNRAWAEARFDREVLRKTWAEALAAASGEVDQKR